MLEKVGKMIIENFEKLEFDVATIFYNKFKNVITQIPQEQQIIPLKTTEAEIILLRIIMNLNLKKTKF